MSDSPSDRLPPKKEVALALLEGESVFIHLDPRREGVLVPKQFVKQTQLVLQVGLKLAIRIPDLHIDDEGISCTLSFNRAPFWCRMPWASIYALVGPDGRGMLWPDDVPPEVAAQMRAGRGKSAAKRPRPRLSAVRSESAGDTPTDAAAAPPSADKGPLDAPDSSAEGRVMRRPRPRAVPTPVPSLAAVPPPAGAAAGPRRPTLVPSISAPRADDPPPRGAHVKSPPPPPASAPPERGGRGAAPRTGTQAGGSGSGPASGGGDATKRPKRELPPYLRVVK